MTNARPIPDFRIFLTWLLLGLVVLRAVVPIGFMPNLASLQDGKIQITICTAQGQQPITLDATSGHDSGATPDRGLCDIGLIVSAMMLAAILWLCYRFAIIANRQFINARSVSYRTIWHNFAASRAPPSFCTLIS